MYNLRYFTVNLDDRLLYKDIKENTPWSDIDRQSFSAAENLLMIKTLSDIHIETDTGLVKPDIEYHNLQEVFFDFSISDLVKIEVVKFENCEKVTVYQLQPAKGVYSLYISCSMVEILFLSDIVIDCENDNPQLAVLRHMGTGNAGKVSLSLVSEYPSVEFYNVSVIEELNIYPIQDYFIRQWSMSSDRKINIKTAFFSRCHRQYSFEKYKQHKGRCNAY